jgi:hypothetical protein
MSKNSPTEADRRLLRRLRKIARRRGWLIRTIRRDQTLYLVNGERNTLFWPESVDQRGTGATLDELREALEAAE